MLRRQHFAIVLLAACSAMTAQTRVSALQEAAQRIDQQDLAQAETILNGLLQHSPADPVAMNLLGVVRMKQGEAGQAEALFRRAIATEPRLAGPHVNLAQIYGKQRAVEAIAELAAALKLAPQNEQARSLLRTIAGAAAAETARFGKREEALAIMLRACDALPHDPQILLDTALAALEAGQPRDAQQYLLDAVKIQPDFQPAVYALARAYLADNKAQDAEEQMRRYLTSNRDDPTAWYGLGYILVAEQKTSDAREAFLKSLALRPDQTESIFQLAEMDFQDDRRDAARERYQQVLARDSQHAGAITGLGMIAYRSGEYADAERSLKQAVTVAPSYQKAHYYYALTLKKLGKQADAEREFRTSAELQKHDAPEASRSFTIAR